MDNYLQAIALNDIRRGDDLRQRAIATAGNATAGFYDTQGDIAKLGVQRALQDNTIRGRWNQAMALAAIRSNYANAVATKQATMARERDNTATLRQLAMKGFPVDPKLSVEENIGNAAKWAEKKELEAVDSAAANLQRFDDDEASLQEQLDATQSALESDRSKYIAGKTKEAFAAQFTPEQIAEINKQMESRPARSRPIPFEVAAANYAASKKLSNVIPMNQIEATVADEFDTMKDNPILARHTQKARQIASAIQKNRNERSDFLQYSPHARTALGKQRSAAKPKHQAALNLELEDPKPARNFVPVMGNVRQRDEELMREMALNPTRVQETSAPMVQFGPGGGEAAFLRAFQQPDKDPWSQGLQIQSERDALRDRLTAAIASKFNVQPEPIGSSVFSRAPKAIINRNPSRFDAMLEALPIEERDEFYRAVLSGR